MATLSLSACTTLEVSLPPITEDINERHDVGRVVWHDLLTTDLDAAKTFYSELFGWEFRDVGLNLGSSSNDTYSIAWHNGRPIAGMVDTSLLETGTPLVQWVSIFSVDDIEQKLAAVMDNGGSHFGGVRDLGARGEISVVTDADGALFAILETATGDPAETSPGIGDFLWDELWTNDSQPAGNFYQSLFPYTAASESLADNQTYNYYTSQGRPRVAIINNPLEELAPTWVSYIRVEDPASITARVSDLGGEVILEAQANPIGGEVAIIRDPSGAGLVIQTWTERN